MHPWLNRLQTAFLVGILLAICVAAGWLLLGELGLWIALLGGVLALIIEPVAAWRLTLRLYQASPIHPEQAPILWQMTALLAERAALPSTPVLFYVPSPLINAFAVGGRKQAAIALTDGLLRGLTQRELAGVLAHEIAHIAHDDLRVMGLADYVSRVTHLFSSVGQWMVLLSLPWLFIEGYSLHFNAFAIMLLLFSPHLALLAQLGLSRVREYDADFRAGELTGDPMGLAYALARIEQASRSWLSILLPGWGNPEPSWLRSHPETTERIRRLQEQAEAFSGHASPQRIAGDSPLDFFEGSIRRLPGWRRGGLWH